jgi:hypothetical protein
MYLSGARRFFITVQADRQFPESPCLRHCWKELRFQPKQKSSVPAPDVPCYNFPGGIDIAPLIIQYYESQAVYKIEGVAKAEWNQSRPDLLM